MDPQESFAERAGDSYAVEITCLEQELFKELDAISSSEAQLDGPILIAKVSDLARNVDPVEYDPHHVSIGPYHRVSNQNDPDISREDEKTISLRAVLSAASPNVTVGVYLQEMKHLRDQAARCYQHHEFEGISNKDFVRMMLLDACYLLSMFSDINTYEGGRRKNNKFNVLSNGHVQGDDHSCSTPLVSAAARSGGDKLKDVAAVRDVFYLAENQLPFFILKKIYELSNLEGSSSAAETISSYIQELLHRRNYSIVKPNVAELPCPGNLLHLLHMHLKPTAISQSTTCCSVTGESMGPWRTATDYHFFAGVKFKNRPLGNDGCQSILDVRPADGGSTLEIPCLNIDGETWRILRNLIALEQRNPGTTGSDVTAYCFFISQLACTASDVNLLSRSGVISNTCGNHGKVAGFFSDLCSGVVTCKEDDEINYLKGTWFALEKRIQSRRFRWLAWLRQKYFKNPWLTIGLAAAASGLTCEVVQAVYSVLGNNH